ncbi:protein tyrosine phosphatase [Sphingobacterium sp. UT-1RO-CII-1]|uniref:tyrosine-protein phosphatase n=1 Tax=Sphingobacterium sp. UT-1RO-CII-1 TaxID=2995225 RepID=UPI00227BC449|nr:CpsB/CapC family capsule biosynthesis tyrosine phosphatase [Sphingobacterium sp. UT-1RO-CII-1]MCY4778519.1 protein tyrosine phosphatase [Sphingobacterium sp. UT-1RO-CII-1]
MSLWTKLFGEKKELSSAGKLEWLTWDMHSHLLPGIDDGAKTIQDSLLLIKGLKDLGIHKCITTPHVIFGVYDNSKEEIMETTEKLRKELLASNIEFDLKCSAEYMIDDGLLQVLDKKALCLMPNNYVLIEMSYLAESNMLMEVIYSLQSEGYYPVLAHPERYNYYHGNFEMYKAIKEAGCLLQLNILAISGYYGERVKDTAHKLIKERMYDFVGTDMHHERHLNAIKKLLERYDVKDLLKNNPIRNATAF